jgi:hypothetical protein
MALLVDEHSRFFNHLADLVDPRYFHDDGREHVNLKYMKKEARMSTKRAFKEQHKKNKRAKLDPDAAKTTTEVQRQQMQQQQGNDDEDAQEPTAAAHSMGRLNVSSGKPATGGLHMVRTPKRGFCSIKYAISTAMARYRSNPHGLGKVVHERSNLSSAAW